ncbi:3809_t:CDS:10 [Dentiscutata erythropus]|uniref:3809_t:CDS:1 n=1 Tax=Dentiscutata erythropus TaxID=1348616 RepID=A0A9N9ERJ4_9GLOM|nr:3809_t:CDS:10 [Dentiscutata erythropus]
MAFNEQSRFQFTQLENMIWHSLDNHLYRNAIFLAERLHAQDQNNENSRFLLATCYYRNGQKKAAYMLLKEAQSIKCKYLFAKCCLDLNKAGEGEEKLRSVLSEIDDPSSDTFAYISKNNQPDASSVLCLLGALCKQAKRPEDAAHHYLCCIKKNPYMWEAFESLCQLGKSNQVDIDEIFQSTTEKSTRIPCADLFRNSQMFVPQSSLKGEKNSRRSMQISSLKTALPLISTSVTDIREKKRSRIANDERILIGIDDEKKWSKVIREGKTITNVENEVVRPNITEALQKTSLSPQVNLEFTGNCDKVDDTNLKSDNEFLLLLKQFAKGYGYLSQYECAKAIEVFSELPPSQQNTAWVQSHMAKAHFEMVDYLTAEHFFQKARQLESYRLEDMELYSTTLWHLRKDTDLSALAHELIEFERRSPQTWCAVGNCFSRQQEHDVALKCFRRAIQLDQSFTYAHTLSGHESMANANYEDAQKHFRNALNTNNRHYNALYGLANYYITCGKTHEAEQNYRMAMKINPNHAVLMCCLGKVLEKMGKVEEARSLYDRACQVTPQTPLAIFKKAKSLYRDKQYEDALAELEKLKKTVPNEPKVYFLIAKIHKAMGERAKATQNFTFLRFCASKVTMLMHHSDKNQEHV